VDFSCTKRAEGTSGVEGNEAENGVPCCDSASMPSRMRVEAYRQRKELAACAASNTVLSVLKGKAGLAFAHVSLAPFAMQTAVVPSVSFPNVPASAASDALTI